MAKIGLEKELEKMSADLRSEIEMHTIAIGAKEEEKKKAIKRLAQVDVCLKALEFDRRGSVKIVEAD